MYKNLCAGAVGIRVTTVELAALAEKFRFGGIDLDVSEAAELLGFQLFASLVNDFTLLAGQILLGLVIFGTGLLLANWASRAIREGGLSQAGLLGTAAQVAIIALAGAMALRQMGFANEIINLAFGLTLGALAVALAIAFGLGGRKTAGREIENMVDAIRTKKNPKPKPKKTRK